MSEDRLLTRRPRPPSILIHRVLLAQFCAPEYAHLKSFESRVRCVDEKRDEDAISFHWCIDGSDLSRDLTILINYAVQNVRIALRNGPYPDSTTIYHEQDWKWVMDRVLDTIYRTRI